MTVQVSTLMETVQIAISNAEYCVALRDLLERNGTWNVVCTSQPDTTLSGVLVVDLEHLERISPRAAHPQRVVLITGGEAEHLKRAWEAGVNSVVSRSDPLGTVLLAVLAARLRVPRASAAEKTEL